MKDPPSEPLMETKHVHRIGLEQLERRDTPAFMPLPAFTAGLVQSTVVATADFNGDGFADVAVGNAQNGGSAPSIGIALGQGDGRFTLFQNLTTPLLETPQAIVITDFNKDGHRDLAVASYSAANDVGSVLVFLGQADGSFTGPAFQSPIGAIAVGVADFTSDGNPDIVALNPDSLSIAGGYQIFAGDGQGKFALSFGQQGFPFDVNRVVTGDFDNDGFADFVALDTADQLIFTFFGDGTGNFTVPNGFAALPFAPFDIVSGDYNNDGLRDLVISSQAGDIRFHENLGGRQFELIGVNLTTVTSPSPYRLASADVVLNGVPDVIAVSRSEARVFQGTFGTGFIEDPTGPFPLTAPTFSTDVAIGDANGDGNPDFIVARRSGSATPPSDGTVFLNLDRVPTVTNLTAAPNPGIGGTQTILSAVVGFNGRPFPFGVQPIGDVTFELNEAFLGTAPIVNGVATLPVTLAAGTYTILARYPGDTRFLPSSSPTLEYVVNPANVVRAFQYEVTGLPTLPELGPDHVASGSFNGDDTLDIVLGAGSGRIADITVIDGKSRQELYSEVPFGLGFTGGVMVAAGDIDGDGVADVAVAADLGGGPRVRIYFSRGDHLEAGPDFFALDPEFRGGLRVALGDVNGDGYADLVVTGGPGAGPRVATYDGRTLLPGHLPERLFNDFFAMAEGFRLGLFVAVGDMNNDGLAEIAVSSDVGGGPHISIFDGESLVHGTPEEASNFFVGDPNSRGGVRIAIRDVSTDEGIEFLTGDGVGVGSTVRLFAGFSVYQSAEPVPLFSNEVLPGFLGGVFVA